MIKNLLRKVIIFMLIISSCSLMACKNECKHTTLGTIVVTQPTCTKDGLEKDVCKKCTVTVAERVIPKLGHDFGEWQTVWRITQPH